LLQRLDSKQSDATGKHAEDNGNDGQNGSVETPQIARESREEVGSVDVCPRPGVAPEDLGELARVFLRAVAIGAPTEELAVALARTAVEAAGLGAAVAVLEGGPFITIRAIELAQLLLASDDASDRTGTATREGA
jgi:hypothetical protein